MQDDAGEYVDAEEALAIEAELVRLRDGVLGIAAGIDADQFRDLEECGEALRRVVYHAVTPPPPRLDVNAEAVFAELERPSVTRVDETDEEMREKIKRRL
jgi:hypothetical protein